MSLLSLKINRMIMGLILKKSRMMRMNKKMMNRKRKKWIKRIKRKSWQQMPKILLMVTNDVNLQYTLLISVLMSIKFCMSCLYKFNMLNKQFVNFTTHVNYMACVYIYHWLLTFFLYLYRIMAGTEDENTFCGTSSHLCGSGPRRRVRGHHSAHLHK